MRCQGGLLTPHGLRRGGIMAEDEVKYGLGVKEAGARSEAASRTRSLTSANVRVSRFPWATSRHRSLSP